MTKPIIQVKNISKQYTIGERVAYGSLREEIMQTLTAPFRRLGHGAWRMAHRAKTDLHPSGSKPLAPGPMPSDSTIWALKDVSFDVQEGEVVGIIGRNGAGKSTLLKILSRITEPTSGRIEMRGRVASLLEVGTGFHPELTGRENILLNGALLGMNKEEIKSKFDEIVSFSEIEKFLDTPVKRYSSGMSVRLAFAVAAHLEPEILIIDEVLAVGDAAFQKKCLGKMGEVAKAGRTVLLVSHNMDSINTLCSRTIMLTNGKVVYQGTSEEGIRRYLENQTNKGSSLDLSDGSGDFFRKGKRQYAQITSISITDPKSQPTDTFEMGKPFVASLTLTVKQRVVDPEVGFCISTTKGARLHHLISKWENEIGPLEPGAYRFSAGIDMIMLYPGTYTLTAWYRNFSREGADDFIESALIFKVIKSSAVNAFADFTNVSASGGVYVKSKWEIEKVNMDGPP
jgi:homopolymeric O-antigen transport system ATP-binding protein